MSSHETGKGHILIVEDYKTNQKILIHHLQNGGFTFELAENGEDAIECYKNKRFDLILMDILMPVMDGLTATRRIRELEQTNDIRTPILAISATVEEGDGASYLDAGMDDFLEKPIRKDVLYTKLNQWIVGNTPQEESKPRSILPTSSTGGTLGASQPMDEKLALEMYAGNQDVMRKIAIQFLGMVSQQIEVIQLALKKQDADIIHREAHSIKGAAQTFAAEDLAKSALALEKLAASGTLNNAQPLIDEVIRQSVILKTYTQQWKLVHTE